MKCMETTTLHGWVKNAPYVTVDHTAKGIAIIWLRPNGDNTELHKLKLNLTKQSILEKTLVKVTDSLFYEVIRSEYETLQLINQIYYPLI